MSQKNPFGRPRTYQLHMDEGNYVPDSELPSKTLRGVREVGSDRLKEWVASEKMEHPARTFFAKMPASFNDPRCVYYVLDMLCRSRRGTYVRPSYLSSAMQQKHPQYYWDAGVMGRIMAGIATVNMESYYGIGEDGHELTYVDSEKEVPIPRGRDSKGVYYVIDPFGGNEGLLWLLRARARMFELAEKQMQADLYGMFDQYCGHVTQSANWYSDIFAGSIRSPEAFKAQLTPTTPFYEKDSVEERFGALKFDVTNVGA